MPRRGEPYECLCPGRYWRMGSRDRVCPACPSSLIRRPWVSPDGKAPPPWCPEHGIAIEPGTHLPGCDRA